MMMMSNKSKQQVISETNEPYAHNELYVSTY
jgi:hypothetical protein